MGFLRERRYISSTSSRALRLALARVRFGIHFVVSGLVWIIRVQFVSAGAGLSSAECSVTVRKSYCCSFCRCSVVPLLLVSTLKTFASWGDGSRFNADCFHLVDFAISAQVLFGNLCSGQHASFDGKVRSMSDKVAA